MKNKKNRERVQTGKEASLQKSSILFIQLGLVVALFFSYMVIESKTDNLSATNFTATTYEVDDLNTPPEIILKEKLPEIKVKPKTQPKVDLINIKKIDNKTTDEESVFKSSELNEDKPTVITDYKKIVEVIIDEPDVEHIPFIAIEDAPVFPGCKGNQEEIKKCFSSSINAFVRKKFNSELAQELGLSAGKKRINIQFVVGKLGNIEDLKVRAPHKRLEKEAKRIVELLPKMTPGMQRKKPVGVRFNLPIIFEVLDEY